MSASAERSSLGARADIGHDEPDRGAHAVHQPEAERGLCHQKRPARGRDHTGQAQVCDQGVHREPQKTATKVV